MNGIGVNSCGHHFHPFGVYSEEEKYAKPRRVWGICTGLFTADDGKREKAGCTSNAARVSPRQVNALLDKTEPIQAPCGSHGPHIEGTIVLAIAVDANGDVTCVAVVSGHPLIIGSAIDSVRRWKLRSYVVDGLKKDFCGRVAVRYAATDCGLKYEVVQATEN